MNTLETGMSLVRNRPSRRLWLLPPDFSGVQTLGVLFDEFIIFGGWEAMLSSS